jgi:hypothetical protein
MLTKRDIIGPMAAATLTTLHKAISIKLTDAGFTGLNGLADNGLK